LADDVEEGDVLLLDDGLISMRVNSVKSGRIHCEVEHGGVLSNRKGLNLLGGGLSLSGISEQDILQIPLIAKMAVDYVAVSFPRNASDLNQARRHLRAAGSNAGLIAKIERSEAITNLAEICDASDALLVARGDLGVEIGDAALPGLQKQIIATAVSHNRVVGTATQMMQSMVDSPIPTRAEVLDVANAVLDGSDAVMLSAETAVGRHPVRVVEAMHRVCIGAESHSESEGDIDQLNVRFQRIDQAIAMAAMFLATHVSVQAILALTESGRTAQWLSRVQSSVPIYASSPNEGSRRKMALYRNVYPIAHQLTGTQTEPIIREGLKTLLELGHVEAGDRIIVTMGDQLGNRGGTNTMRLIKLGADGYPEHQSELDLR
jgi:pyruvate kinase